jgi:two-component system sensor histidine kinase BaeS
MKLKLIHKLLIAMFACTALVLLLVTLLTRASIGRGFVDFLQQQERNQVELLVPELADWYSERGSWEALSDNPREFRRLVFVALLDGSETRFDFRPEGEPGALRAGRRGGRNPGGPGPGPGQVQGQGPGQGPGPGPGPGRRNTLPQRIFLLSNDMTAVIGQVPANYNQGSLMPIDVDGQNVGWLGIAWLGDVKLPEEEAFILQLRKSLIIGLGLGLLIAAILSWLLARHLSRPVNEVAGGIRALAAGDFKTRLKVRGEDEISRLGDDVNRLSSALSEHESVRKRWVADMAHELRTPLAIIRGELEAMYDGVRPLGKQQLASVQEEVKHLTSLVDDLHSLNMTDSGALAYKMQNVNLTDLIELSVDSFQGRVLEKNLQVSWVNPPQQVNLNGDEQRLRQLMHNLLDNAVRYTDADGSISLLLSRDRQAVKFSISDSTPGASPEECERLFERLYRLEGSRNRNSGGSGLGLAICRNIVEAHGGQIVAKPSQAGGLEITVTLPLNI